MGCTSCGDMSANTSKDFTKAVIEINNPESLVLLRKVVIPASMGDDTVVKPAIGKYRNVILYYEANKHVYLYSSDGIPTQIEMPQEVFERLTDLESETVNLQQEIDDLKNSPDVVDIVATYSDLQAYDTSSLGDNDIIRVLSDETHDGDSSYYRWNKTNNQWMFIGSVDVINVVQTTGNSTTDVMSQKAVTDALAGAGGDITKFYFDESESAPSAHINIYKDKAMTQLATSADVWNAKDTGFELVGLEVASSDPLEVYEYNVYPAIFLQDESMNESATNVNWCTYSYGSISMWNMQNNLSYATYTNTTIPTVVQATGTSTTDVMSQDAVTNALNALPTGGVTVLTTADYNWPTNNPTGIAPWLLDIGWYTAEDGVKIFQNPATSATVSWYYGRSFYVGIGRGPGGTEYVRAKYTYTIGEYGFSPAQGDGAYAWITWFANDNSGMQAVLFPSLSNLSERVIRKAGAPTASTVGKVGTLCEDTANGDLYICTDATNPYVWEEVGGGPATFTTNEWNALWA